MGICFKHKKYRIPIVRTGWWFGTWILFVHSVGKFIIPTDEVIFFRGVGWNHQPARFAAWDNLPQFHGNSILLPVNGWELGVPPISRPSYIIMWVCVNIGLPRHVPLSFRLIWLICKNSPWQRRHQKTPFRPEGIMFNEDPAKAVGKIGGLAWYLHSYWKLPFIVSFRLKMVMFRSYVSLPEGISHFNKISASNDWPFMECFPSF